MKTAEAHEARRRSPAAIALVDLVTDLPEWAPPRTRQRPTGAS
ncbi:hypothetical protein [Nocardia sp. X0981]